MRKLHIAVIFTLVDDPGQQLRYCATDTLHVAVSVEVVCGGGDFWDAKKLVKHVPKLQA